MPLNSSEFNYGKGKRLQEALECYVDFFQVDMDGRSWSACTVAIQRFSDSFPVKNVTVQRDTVKGKHYHFQIYLARPYPLFMVMAMRELLHDDPKRHYLDMVRLFDSNFEDYDWLANAKYKMDLETEEFSESAQYATKKAPKFTRMLHCNSW